MPATNRQTQFFLLRHWLAIYFVIWYGVPYMTYDIFAMYLSHYHRFRVKGLKEYKQHSLRTVNTFVRKEFLLVLHHIALLTILLPVTLVRGGGIKKTLRSQNQIYIDVCSLVITLKYQVLGRVCTHPPTAVSTTYGKLTSSDMRKVDRYNSRKMTATVPNQFLFQSCFHIVNRWCLIGQIFTNVRNDFPFSGSIMNRSGDGVGVTPFMTVRETLTTQLTSKSSALKAAIKQDVVSHN